MTSPLSLTGAAITAGVAGWPVAHSLSPLLMRLWIEAAGLNAVYAPFAIHPDTARSDIKALARMGLSGLNVTLPHKETALDLADDVTEAAQVIGAANRLVFRDGRIEADNTDAAGFLQALLEADCDPSDGPVLMLGAGGAARAVLYALVRSGAPEIRIANRTADRARALAADLAPEATLIDWEARSEAVDGARLIINTTSLGLTDRSALDLDLTAAAPGAAAADIVYTPLMTGFLTQARAAGLTVIDGLGMLIGQARPSFESFYGAPPPDAPDVRSALTRALEAPA